MKLKHCRLCDKVFATPGPNVCPDCWDELDKVYTQARAALRDHWEESLNLFQLSEVLNVDAVYLETLVEQGRLEFSHLEGDEEGHCRSCGTAIRRGEQYCDSCRQNLMRGFSVDTEHKKSTMFSQERRDRRVR
ncbi:MAG: hypothetical protein CSA35_04795 [Dethiosulfovibrio peptidovorans]|nr:MAG: hypothetical protein CSA35_04795 [Dethiosulfovibrio peptidovorans]